MTPIEDDDRLFDALVLAVLRGSHETDVARQFGVTVEEVRALMYRNACEAFGEEEVERMRLESIDRLERIEMVFARKAAAGDEDAAHVVAEVPGPGFVGTATKGELRRARGGTCRLR